MNENPQASEGQQGERPDENTTSTGSTDNTSTPAISQPSAGSPETPVTAATGAESPAEQVPTQAPGIAPASPGAAFGPAATAPTEQVRTEQVAAEQAPPSAAKRRSIAVPVIAALAVGAVLGGASGAGIFALADANNSSSVVTTATSQPNVVVNRTEDATTVTAVAAKASPSVVTISVTGADAAGTGSGVVLSADGYILTNTHVVTLDGASADGQIQVTTNDGKIYAATVVGTDPIVDLAVIKLTDASGLTPITFGDSENLNVGDSAIAIGAPLGLSGTVTDGIVSALNRSITVASSAVPDSSGDDSSGDSGQGDSGQSGPYDFWNFDIPGQEQSQSTTASSSISLPVIQTDAAINPGNSGGALLDASGQLIGINVAIASAGSSSSGEQSGNIGVGFAIPANLAQRVAKEIMANGSASHGLLGATVADAMTADAEAGIAGAYLNDISSGGAAEQAGLQKGDIITQFNGVAVTSQTDLTAQVRYLAAGSKAELVYVRNG